MLAQKNMIAANSSTEGDAVALTRQGWIAGGLCYIIIPLFTILPTPGVFSGMLGLLLFGLILFSSWRTLKGWFWVKKYRSVVPHAIAATVIMFLPLAGFVWIVIIMTAASSG